MAYTRFLACGLLLATPACYDGPVAPAVVVQPPDARPYVTGEALSALDAAGHFVMPRGEAPGPYPQVNEEQAERIALGVIHTWYSSPESFTLPGFGSLRESAEEQHGAPINWAALAPGPRFPYFAESHLQPLPASVDDPTIRHFGPRFLVSLYDGPVPVIAVSVSAYATNISLDDRGFVRRIGLEGGGEFRVGGVPRHLDGVTLPPAPEAAVEFASLATGRRITRIPWLGVPGNRVSSNGARWRLELDAPVTLERVADGRHVTTRHVYVGVWPSIADARLGAPTTPAGLRLFVAAEMQPEVEALGPVDFPLREGYAVDLHEVRPAR